MKLLGGLLLLALLTYASADYIIQCEQGSVLTYVSGRKTCLLCPENTYWDMILEDDDSLKGVRCTECPRYHVSPVGAVDFTKCVCNDTRCEPIPSKGTHLGLITGIVGGFIGIGVVVGGLFWCRIHGPEFCGNQAVLHDSEEDDSLLHHGSPSPNLLDCEVKIDIPEEQLEDNYNDVTAKGDHNDMEAVLRAAVISEKRRSRAYSMSSMTDLTSRYRTASTSDSIKNYKPQPTEEKLPLPSYPGHTQTNL